MIKDIKIKDRVLGIIGVIFYIIAVGNQTLPLQILNINISNISLLGRMLYNIGYQMFIIAVLIFLFRKTVIPNIKDYFSNIKHYLNHYIQYWFMALGLMYTSNIIIIFFTKNIAGNEQAVRSLLDSYPIYTFFVAVFIAPLLEELIFRRSIRNIIQNNTWLFVIISGFLFGSMHIIDNVNYWTDLLYIFPYSLPGCVFAYTLVKSDNIMVPVSLHMIHNGILMGLQIILAFLK